MSNTTVKTRANDGIGAKIGTSVKKFLRFCKDNPGFTIGMIVMVGMVFVALFAEQICPHDPYSGSPKDKLLPLL